MLTAIFKRGITFPANNLFQNVNQQLFTSLFSLGLAYHWKKTKQYEL